MMILSRLGTFLILAALTSPARAQTADGLVAKNLAARGGAHKLRTVRTMMITGTITLGGETSPISIKVRRPNQIREEFKVQGAEIARAFDGTAGWQSQKSGEEKKIESLGAGEANNIREEAENAIDGPLLDYSKKGSKLEMLGRDVIGGKPVYKLKVTTHLGTSITQFLDAATFLEVHEEIERTVNGKVVLIVEDVGDYREVEGIKFAHQFISGTTENPRQSVLQIDKIELNVPVERRVFAMPK
jgi:hypothetical protein